MVSSVSEAQEHRFAGARRAEGFDEPPAPEEQPAPSAPSPPTGGWDRFAAPAEPAATVTGSWAMPAPTHEAPATWGAKRRWVKILSLGLASAKPGDEERAHRIAEQAIRSATWPRAVRVAVVNPKGGVGKTPTSLIIGGIAARLRGGGVAIWDAGDSAGSLALRAEGTQSACISAIAAHPDDFSTPGTISAAVARQSTFAAVIGSRSPREFDGQSVTSVMKALDQSFSISIADTGNVPHSPAWRYTVGYSDALVIPTAPTRDSVDKVLDVLARVRNAPPIAHLADRATIVINRGLGGDPAIAKEVRGIFEQHHVGSIIDVPFDKVIADNAQLCPNDLSHESTVAWTQVTAAVISSIVISQRG